MKYIIKSTFLALCILSVLLITSSTSYANGGSTLVTTEAELKTAVEGVANFDVILGNDITLTSALSITTAGSLDGGGFTLTVPVTGTDDLGVANSNPSNFNVLNINAPNFYIVLKNMTIKGGGQTAILSSGANTYLDVSNLIITQTGSTAANGGALYLSGIGSIGVFVDCSITRNVANYGGGFLNQSATLIFERTSIIENRNIGGSGRGGGGGQNQGTLYLNNSILANNQSTEIGGAINNYGGTLYILNSDIVGNISTNSSGAHFGGGVGNNGGIVYVLNSILANNYSTDNSATYVASDLGVYSGGLGNIHSFNSIIGANVVSSDGTTSALLGDAVDSTINEAGNSQLGIFNGYVSSALLNADGTEVAGTHFNRPLLMALSNGSSGAYLSSTSTSLLGGTDIYFDYTNPNAIILAYGNPITYLVNTAGATSTISVYQDLTARSATTIGSLGSNSNTYYTLIVQSNTNGSVSGGTVFGDVYVSGTNLTLTATPDPSWFFEKWQSYDGTTWSDIVGATSTPYTFALTSNLTIRPVFFIPSTDASLSSVLGQTISTSGGSGTSGDPLTASITVPYPLTAVALSNLISTDSNATITLYNASDFASTETSISYPNDNPKVVYIKVIAQDASTTLYYAITINRDATIDASLSDMTVNNGVLSPAFAFDTINYSANVTYATNTITVSPTTSQPGASVTVNGNAVLSGGSSDPVSLTEGANTITVVVTASDGTTIETYTISVTRAAAPPPSNTDDDPIVILPGTETTEESTPSAQPIAQVNGQTSVAGILDTIIDDQGILTTSIIVDQASLMEELSLHPSNAIVTLPFADETGHATGQLNGQMIKDMEDRTATIVIQTPKASYTLPAHEINISAISNELGRDITLSDILVSVSISTPDDTMIKIVEDVTKSGNLSLVVPSVDFNIQCDYNGSRIEVKTFNAYVERRIAIPDGYDPSMITTGIVVTPSGTSYHVPTYIEEVDGKYYALINSMTNSTYSVVWNPLEYTDAQGHWAEDTVNNMGSRMVIEGYEDGSFNPNGTMTRAEFVETVVKGLGLPPTSGMSPYSDVASASDIAGYITTATEYGLVSGFDDGSFRPNQMISREQAMVIIAKAMKLTNIDSNLHEAAISNLLTGFDDADEIASYARSSIADCINAGLVHGRSATTLKAKALITRAETATIMELLLQNSNLIN